jgi:hypothetical protein
MLTLRPTGLSSPAYRDLVDHIVIQDDRAVGRSIGHLNAQSPMTALPRPTFCLGAFSVAKFVRGEDHDIKSGTIEMTGGLVRRSNYRPFYSSRRRPVQQKRYLTWRA